LIIHLKTVPLKKLVGVLNYINCRLFDMLFERSYFHFCCFAGTMILTILEVFRRVIAPYEDRKLADTSDVFSKEEK